MELLEAKQIAEKYIDKLKPYCLRAEIAGSIRREKPQIKDIEIVVIPNNKTLREFCELVNSWKKIKGEPIGKYTQRILPEGIKFDLFIANEKNWGNIFLIRTGNWQFSKTIMRKILEKGLKQKDGYLWDNNQIIECREEEDIFKILQIDFIEPQDRNKEVYIL